MFSKKSDKDYRSPMEGVEFKALVHGEKTMLCEFRIKGGRKVPSHAHPHEQTGYLVYGKMIFVIGEERFDVAPGDSWCIPGNTPHSAEILEDSLIVEVFSPPREDYL
ncbi:MAG: cupin domain-containing protein [Deltaproteobacteria bacterium]|nr:MAG: cupin domain-containing protein [Deltaproteobacteria bacterium]